MNIEKSHEQTLTKDSFAEVIAKEGMTYEASPYNVSGGSPTVDASQFSELQDAYTTYIQSIADSFHMYLSCPMITDSIANHGQRRLWRNKMTSKYGDEFERFYEQNRMKGNTLYALYSWCDDLRSHLAAKNVQSEKLQKLKDLLTNLPDITNYDELDVDQKREVVRSMDNFAFDFLKLVTLPHE